MDSIFSFPLTNARHTPALPTDHPFLLRANFLTHEDDVGGCESDDRQCQHGHDVRPDLQEALPEGQVAAECSLLALQDGNDAG